jgi:hypothetical protein
MVQSKRCCASAASTAAREVFTAAHSPFITEESVMHALKYLGALSTCAAALATAAMVTDSSWEKRDL